MRLVFSSVMARLAALLPLPLIYALGALTYVKLAHPTPELQARLTFVGVALLATVAIGVAHAALRGRPKWSGARALDAHHGLKDRVTNALSFAQETHPTPLMEAAISDALRYHDKLSPRKAVPLRVPSEFIASLLLAGAVYGISLLEVRTTRLVTHKIQTVQPMPLDSEDVEFLKELAQQLEEETKDPEALAAVRRFNQLVEDIAERQLDRKEIFQRLEQLENELLRGSELDSAAMDEGLKGLAEELKKSKLTKPVAEAMEDKNLPDAEEAMRKLAERLKQQKPGVSKQELERLRKALDAASKKNNQRLERLNAQRTELEEQRRRLLKKKNEGKPLSKSEQQQLKQNDRQLKKLDRKKKQSEKAKKEFSELDKELAKAAQELMKELGDAAQSMESGAESLNRMAKKELSRKEKEALKKQLEEMRQMLRQAKKGGKKRREMLERFRRMARGGQQSGNPGGKPGQGKGQGQGQGQGQGKGPGKLSLGQGQPGGGGVEVPIPGQGSSSSAQQGGQDPGTGAGQGGKQWGSGSDPNVRGDKTDLQGQTKDVAAAGVDSGEGSASSEVVYGAAERGFTGRGYQKIYTDYKTVAEEVMESDDIPPGYKFYVRRYFQLIRPRQ